MEKIAKEAGGQLWFQLYMWREKALSQELVRRAVHAGYQPAPSNSCLGGGLDLRSLVIRTESLCAGRLLLIP
jgi:hypothetical protein